MSDGPQVPRDFAIQAHLNGLKLTPLGPDAIPEAVVLGNTVWIRGHMTFAWAEGKPGEHGLYVTSHPTAQVAHEHAARINQTLSWTWKKQ